MLECSEQERERVLGIVNGELNEYFMKFAEPNINVAVQRAIQHSKKPTESTIAKVDIKITFFFRLVLTRFTF